MGLDVVVMNSETNSEDSYRTEDKNPWLVAVGGI